MSRWVQHMSGQGKKYELTDNIWNREDNSSWEAHNTISKNLSWLYLPRSEYLECQPPWLRMTGEMQVSHNGTLIHKEGGTSHWKVCLVIEEGE